MGNTRHDPAYSGGEGQLGVSRYCRGRKLHGESIDFVDEWGISSFQPLIFDNISRKASVGAMLRDYERETFDDLVRRVEADAPECVGSFRARRRLTNRTPRLRLSVVLASVMVVSVLLAVLLVVLGQPAGALPTVLLVSVLAGLLGAGVSEQPGGAL